MLEVGPGLVAIAVLIGVYRRFPMSYLVYGCVFVHLLILIYGGYYTYAGTPLGNWAKEAFGLAERVRRALEGKICTFEGKPIPVTCSIGVATHQGNRYPSPEEMLKAADEALYRSKQSGRNRVTLVPTETPPALPPSGNGW